MHSLATAAARGGDYCLGGGGVIVLGCGLLVAELLAWQGLAEGMVGDAKVEGQLLMLTSVDGSCAPV